MSGWTLKLYKVPRGNGWNGSKSNLGSVYVTAFSKSEARRAVKADNNWSLVGPAEEVSNFLVGENVLR